MILKPFFAKFISLFSVTLSFGFLGYGQVTKPEPTYDMAIVKIEDCFHQGKILADKDARIESLEKCIALIEGMPNDDQLKPKTQLLWIACKGEMAELKSKLVALGYLNPLRERAMSLNEVAPEHHYGAADRILGRLYQRAPRFISYGSSDLAEKHFLNALKIAPEFPGNLLFYADFLKSEGRIDEAKVLAQRALRSKEIEKFPLEKESWLQMGRSITEDGK